MGKNPEVFEVENPTQGKLEQRVENLENSSSSSVYAEMALAIKEGVNEV